VSSSVGSGEAVLGLPGAESGEEAMLQVVVRSPALVGGIHHHRSEERSGRERVSSASAARAVA
jgi:hypothetical protein